MNITVCIGSACHLKGSWRVVEQLESLIETAELKKDITLNGVFCTGNCRKEVNLTVDGQVFSVSPENTSVFFEEHILGKMPKAATAAAAL